MAWIIRRADGPLLHNERFARGGLLGWDADWYRRIAVHGYQALPPEAARFFPLLPLLARAFGGRTWVGAGIVLLVVANATALTAGAALHRLVLDQTASEAVARRAVAWLALAPPAFVLVMGYAEGIALTAIAVVLVAARRRRWWAVVAWGLVAGLCRPTGVLLCVPVAVEVWQAHRGGRGGRGGLRSWLRPWLRPRPGPPGPPGRPARPGRSGRRELAPLAAVAAPAVGTAAYLAWCWWRLGDAFLPYSVQNVPGLRGSSRSPLATVADTVVDAVRLHPGTHTFTVLVAVVLCVVACRRWPASWSAYAVVVTATALGAQRLGSLERYEWGTLVLVATLAAVVRGRAYGALLAASAAGLGVLTTVALLGGYVP